ncbi:DUF3168 domain-containing protein [Stenotrophomonas sp. S4]
MSYESSLHALIAPLVQGRFYPDIPPDQPVFPFAVYQQVGGQALWFLEGSIPDHKHARVQITIWSKSRSEANTLIRRIEDAICSGVPHSEPYGAAVAMYESSIKGYGARLDFGLWFPDP